MRHHGDSGQDLDRVFNTEEKVFFFNFNFVVFRILVDDNQRRVLLGCDGQKRGLYAVTLLSLVMCICRVVRCRCSVAGTAGLLIHSTSVGVTLPYAVRAAAVGPSSGQ